MKLSEIKRHLKELSEINITLPSGKVIPSHFHITEVGVVNKDFIDCGGTIRNEKVANFQLWEANDYDHRLVPKKLLDIIGKSEMILGNEDLEIEVEYQTETIGKYDLSFNGTHFELLNKQTNCLAKDHCNIPPEQMLKEQSEESCCAPGGGCC